MKSEPLTGCADLCIEHVKHAGEANVKLLATFFTGIIKSDYLPKHMTKTIIIPIIKSKFLDITLQENYRSISIVSPIARISERVLLDQVGSKMTARDNHMGFKRKYSTDTAIFCVK